MSAFFVEGTSKRRREINLGGAHSASSYSDILHDAKTKRLQRLDVKRRQDSAVRIQAWWRGLRELRTVRRNLRQAFDADVTGLTGLRCLVLVGQDEEALAQWSNAVVNSTVDILAHSEPSWHTLLQKVSLMLLQSVSNDPQSPHAVAHLAVLTRLLSVVTNALAYTEHVLEHAFFARIAQAIIRIPVESKASPSLPPLVALSTVPFSQQNLLQQCLEGLLVHILSIPLLPNRFPLQSLVAFSARLPFSSLQVIAPRISDVVNSAPLSDALAKIHLLANLSALVPPRYTKLPTLALDTYLQLTAMLMTLLPVHSLEPPDSSAGVASHWADDDSDSEQGTSVMVVDSFEPQLKLPDIDSRTRKRLQTLPSSDHVSALLAATQRHASKQNIITFFFALSTIWPTRKDKILSSVVAYNAGGLVREIYRGYVRNSGLGRDDSPASLTNPANASGWPPLLFLVDLYTQALLTMGDDEFFSTGQSDGSPRNPLTLDELTSFSRQLLNITFTLYWREDQTNVQEGGVPGLGVLRWESVREKATKCLQAIHVRDSRRPFTPADHWLISSQVDMATFVQAAVFEERQIAEPEGARPLSKRQVTYLSPRLGVLNNIPFAIPFEIRVSIFRHFVANDMVTRGFDEYGRRAQTRVTVRRGQIAQDGFDRLLDADLKAPIAITFVDQFGQEEAGIDGGGVFKEFLTSLCKEVFDTDRGLWLANKKNELYPNPHSYATESHSLSWYRFIGRILGKALYEGILIDVAFAGFFLAKWLGKQSFLDDLASLDPELYSGLIFLKHYTGSMEELSLNFTAAEEEFGVAKARDLIPNGSNIPVTRENRLQYIYLVSHYRLSKQIKQQSDAFFDGLSDLIDPKWLRMFNQQELQILLGGVNSPIDLDDLRKHTHYGGLYDDTEPTIETFWNVVNSFDQEQRRALLRFATSCSRPPLLGFKELVPNFAIRDAGRDENRLPTASTCVNLLKLPRYRNAEVLRSKLLQAINSNAGFDLS